MKVVNKNFVMWDFIYKCNASLQCTCHTCSRLFICSKLTVQFYHLRLLWTHCSSWCNGSLAVLSSVGGKDIAYVYCSDSVILAAYIIALKNISWILTANIQNALSLLIPFVVNPVGGIFSKRLHQCINCGVQKELNWTAYQGSKKILQLQLSVHVCNRCSLFSVSYW